MEVIEEEKKSYQLGLNQEQKRRHKNDIHGLRVVHAWLLFSLTAIWVFFVWIVILFQGFGRWYGPTFWGFYALPFHLSDAVVIAFLTTTTTTVLGLYGIAAYWLYTKPKARPGTAKAK
jgi:hypothetical protein